MTSLIDLQKMIVITLTQLEWRLIIGIFWRVIIALVVWSIIVDVTHILLGSK